MTDGIRVARGVTLPVEYVTKTAAILAQRRKGKTYTAAVIAEELVRLKMPWVALDPTGAWWGLRSSADGEKAGLPVVVLGGNHGDLPLEPQSGAFVADLVLDHPGWYVLDISLLGSRPAEREFATEFGERLLRRKQEAAMDFAMHLFVDEADLFVMQEKENKADVALLAAYSGIVRRGGLAGLGSTLISQRPALINKSALTQLDLLILLRLVAGQDQDAVDKHYVSRFTTKEQRAEIMDSLATMPVGRAWLLEPGAEPEPLIERVPITQRRTFNSSATPKPGERRVEPRVFAKIDIDKLAVDMRDAIERAKDDDPVELRKSLLAARRQIAELEKRPPVAEPERVSVPVVTWNDLAKLQAILNAFEEGKDLIANTMNAARDVLYPLSSNVKDALDRQAVDAHRSDPAPSKPVVLPEARVKLPEPTRLAATNGNLGTSARRFLETMARFYPLRLTVGQLGTLAQRKTRGGSYNTAMRELRDGGYVEVNDSGFELTERGLEEAGVTPEPMTLDRWREVLPVASREILDVLVRAGSPMSVLDVAVAAGRQPRGGSWNTAMKMLTQADLVVKRGDMVCLAEGVVG